MVGERRARTKGRPAAESGQRQPQRCSQRSRCNLRRLQAVRKWSRVGPIWAGGIPGGQGDCGLLCGVAGSDVYLANGAPKVWAPCRVFALVKRAMSLGSRSSQWRVLAQDWAVMCREREFIEHGVSLGVATEGGAPFIFTSDEASLDNGLPKARDIPLHGRVVLIVQRNWAIARALATEFETRGAKVAMAKNSH